MSSVIGNDYEIKQWAVVTLKSIKQVQSNEVVADLMYVSL